MLLIFIAIWAIAIGVMAIVGAIQLRKEIEGEWLLILSGALAILFGILMFTHPAAGALAVVWMIATFAIIFGIDLILLAFKLKGFKDRRLTLSAAAPALRLAAASAARRGKPARQTGSGARQRDRSDRRSTRARSGRSSRRLERPAARDRPAGSRHGTPQLRRMRALPMPSPASACVSADRADRASTLESAMATLQRVALSRRAPGSSDIRLTC